MICCTRRVSRSLSVCIRAAKRSHGLGVVGRLADRLGQQVERADRRLELVADVGDEVAADGVDPALAGAVLDQDEHQPAAQRRDPGRDVPEPGPRSAAGRARSSRIWPSRRTWRTSSSSSRTSTRDPLHQAHHVRGRAGLEHLVVGADDQRGRAQHRQHGGDAGRDQRLGQPARACAAGRVR